MFVLLEENKGFDLNGCRVIYVDRGLGYRGNNVIFLNRELRKFPVLHDDILMHELGHSDKFNFFDVVNDLNPRKLSLDWWRFVFKHKSAWWHFCPLIKLDGEWRFQFMLLFYYFAFLIFLLYIPIKIISLFN